MATKVQKLPFGINEVWLNTLCITTLCIRVRGDFPVKRLPKPVTVEYASNRKGEPMYKLSYAAVANDRSWKVINQVGRLLREHAQKQLDARYSWVSDHPSVC